MIENEIKKSMENKPVYPRPNPEYDKIVYEQLLYRMRNMRWDMPDECGSTRGRKPRQIKYPEKVKPRFRDKYDWLDQAKQRSYIY